MIKSLSGMAIEVQQPVKITTLHLLDILLLMLETMGMSPD